ncbi:MAG: hypothetical protein U0744_20775 [Gemmataceae bacterium]
MSSKPTSSVFIREAIDAGMSSSKEIVAYVQGKRGVVMMPSLANNV